MYGSIRRVSRFASDEELSEAATVLLGGGVVGAPSVAGLMLIASHNSIDRLESMAGEAARLLPSTESVVASGVMPSSLGRWFNKLVQAGLGELWLPAPPSRGPRARVQAPQGGALSKLVRRLGLAAHEDMDDSTTAAPDLDDAPPIPAKRYLIRIADHAITRRLCTLAATPLVASVPHGPDGKGITTAEGARRFRDGVSLILSVAGNDVSLAKRRSVLMRAGMAYAPAFEREHALGACQAHRLLFVCIGNLNRSPYAEAHLKAIMDQEAHEAAAAGFHYCPAWAPGSAGIAAMPGTPAHDQMVAVAKLSLGWAHIEKHAARRFTPTLAQDYDEIMPLDAGVAQTVREFDIGGVPITFSKHQDLADPMGGRDHDYMAAAEAIEEFVARTFLMPGLELPRPEFEQGQRVPLRGSNS